MENILIYGKNTLELILDIDSKLVKKVYINNIIKQDDLLTKCQDARIPIEFIDKFELNRISRGGNHQNFIAEVKSPINHNLNILEHVEQPNPFVIMLDSITDPQNFGAILRVADAVGANAVIYSKNRQVKPNATIAKVSTGAMYSVKLIEVTNLSRTCEQLKKWGFWIVGSALSKDSQNISNYDYKMPICLIIGSEGKGISKNLLTKIDMKVKIPMNGKVQSLNAACAAGILSYKIKGIL